MRAKVVSAFGAAALAAAGVTGVAAVAGASQNGFAEAHGGTARAANRDSGGADVWIVIPSSEL